MPNQRADRALDTIARRQHGCFSRAQAVRAGLTPRMIAQRTSTGAWVRLAPSVYALPSHPGTIERQCWAAVLSEPSAAIGGLTAALLHGLDGIRPGPIELVVPPGSNVRSALATVHRYIDPQLTRCHGLPVTSIPQTILDLAPRLPHDALARLIDGALLRRHTTVDAIARRVATYDGARRAGVPLVRALVHERSNDAWEPPESELERLLRRVLRPLGLPIEWQQSLPWREPMPCRVDALVPASRTIIEADGRRWHARFRDFDRDRWRDNLVVSHGYVPVRLTWVHLTERPAEVRALVRTVTSRAA